MARKPVQLITVRETFPGWTVRVVADALVDLLREYADYPMPPVCPQCGSHFCFDECRPDCQDHTRHLLLELRTRLFSLSAPMETLRFDATLNTLDTLVDPPSGVTLTSTSAGRTEPDVFTGPTVWMVTYKYRGVGTKSFLERAVDYLLTPTIEAMPDGAEIRECLERDGTIELVEVYSLQVVARDTRHDSPSLSTPPDDARRGSILRVADRRL